MGVKILRKEENTKPFKCYNLKGARCHFSLVPYCLRLANMKRKLECLGKTFTQITAAEFNASTGKKWRVKKDVRVLPYEDKLYLHINGEKYPVFPDDTVEDIEKRINDDLEYAEVMIIMEDKL